MAFNPQELGIPTTNEEADAINEAFEIATLRNLAMTYNQTCQQIEKIDLTRVKSKLEFIISLWRCV